MKGLVVEPSTRHVRLEERPDPTPAAGEALIRVRRAGICGTDLEIAQGYMEHAGVLGHEFVGRVERCDSAPQWEGRRVVGELNCACGTCATCLRGDRSHCPRRTVLGILGRDGALATHVVLPVENLHEVPKDLGDEHAVFTEPLAAALEILDRVHVRPTDRALLLGDGRLAQLIGQVLLLTGCHLTVVGRHDNKLRVLAARGARTLLSEELREQEAPERHDLVVEATGSPSGPAQAISLCRPRGTVVLKSTTHGDGGVPVVPTVIDEITVVGSRCGPFAPALRLLQHGAVEVSQLVSGVHPLDRAREAFDYARSREVLKVLLDTTE